MNNLVKRSKRHFPIVIAGIEWQVLLYTPKVYTTLFPDTLGITLYDFKKGVFQLCFDSSCISKDTIAHEVMHAYFSRYCLLGKTPSQIEESACEIVGRNYRRIYRTTNKIFNLLKK